MNIEQIIKEQGYDCPLDTSSNTEECELSNLAYQISDIFTEILEYRGLYDGGKNFTEDVQERIMPLLSQSESRIKAEMVEKIENSPYSTKPGELLCVSCNGKDFVCKKCIINLIQANSL